MVDIIVADYYAALNVPNTFKAYNVFNKCSFLTN